MTNRGQNNQPNTINGNLKKLAAACSPHLFGQQAITEAVTTGRICLSGNFEADLKYIMGRPGQNEEGCYSAIITQAQLLKREALHAQTPTTN